MNVRILDDSRLRGSFEIAHEVHIIKLAQLYRMILHTR